jgi:quercetin dioxygenase-like cupin family protein
MTQPESTMTPRYLGPSEGYATMLLGEPRVFKVTPADNGGTYLQFETSTAPGVRVPPHFHYEEDEAFYVLAGEYEFIIGENRCIATAGSFAFVPRGTIHAFTNTGQEVARMLVTVTPGTQHEGFMREAGELAEQLGKEPEPSQLVTLALKYGWRLVPQDSEKR